MHWCGGGGDGHDFDDLWEAFCSRVDTLSFMCTQSARSRRKKDVNMLPALLEILGIQNE